MKRNNWRRRTIGSRKPYNEKSYPTGSVRSLETELAKLNDERQLFLKREPADASERSHIRAQITNALVGFSSALPILTESRLKAEDGNYYTSAFSTIRDNIAKVLAENVSKRKALQRQVSLLRTFRLLTPFNFEESELHLEEQISKENKLLSILHTFERIDPLISRLTQIEDQTSRLTSLESQISLYLKAIDLEIKRPETQMEILRARAAQADKENRDATSRVKDQIPRTKSCPYCSIALGTENHVDHIVPVNHGGRPFRWNLVRICSDCNLKKGSQTLFEFCAKYGYDYMPIAKRLQDLGKRP